MSYDLHNHSRQNWKARVWYIEKVHSCRNKKIIIYDKHTKTYTLTHSLTNKPTSSTPIRYDRRKNRCAESR